MEFTAVAQYYEAGHMWPWKLLPSDKKRQWLVTYGPQSRISGPLAGVHICRITACKLSAILDPCNRVCPVPSNDFCSKSWFAAYLTLHGLSSCRRRWQLLGQ